MTRNLLLAGTAIVALPTAALAAGIERNAPSTRILFEEGRYLEFSYSSVSPDLTGQGGFVGPPLAPGVAPAAPNGTGDLFPSYHSWGFAYKADLNERLSYAVILDQPVGVDTAYPTVPGSIYGGVLADLNSLQLTGILAYDTGNNVKIYGGVRAQKIEATADIPFIGGYTVNADADWSPGYLVGAAWERPDIAARVALTYYSEIDHTLDTIEFGAIPGVVDISTPQSINLEFQTGIAADTLLFGSIRWVDWSEFAISPPNYPLGTLVDYQEDWTTYTLGVGRRFTENWSGAIQVSHEPAAGYTPFTTLGPVDGRTSIGLAATYTQGKMKITTGITYVDLGQTANLVNTQYDDGDAIGIGVRVGYTF